MIVKFWVSSLFCNPINFIRLSSDLTVGEKGCETAQELAETELILSNCVHLEHILKVHIRIFEIHVRARLFLNPFSRFMEISLKGDRLELVLQKLEDTAVVTKMDLAHFFMGHDEYKNAVAK